MGLPEAMLASERPPVRRRLPPSIECGFESGCCFERRWIGTAVSPFRTSVGSSDDLMGANLRYAIFPEKMLLVERMSGPVSYQDVVVLTKEVWGDGLYDKSYDGIIDIRQASIDMGHSGLESFVQLLLASESASEGRVAVISSKPVETALSYLLANKLTKGGSVSVFSTWGGVAAYLGLSESVLAEIADERAYDAMFD